MDTQPSGLVTVPSVDAPHYFNIFTHYFSAHGWDFWHSLQALVGAIVAISIPITIFFFLMIFVTVESLKKIRNKEDEMFNKPPKVEKTKETKVDEELARRWKKVMEHVNSTNPNDWKQAIIEADVMLEQLVTKLGYKGESLGEKLKRTTKGDFKTRDQAWDAHMVRNRIAHDGSAYQINEIEAKRVIGLYRQVFDEFYDISEQ